MKNVKQEFDDSLRPEYRRSDLGELIQGKFADARMDFNDVVGLSLSCIGEEEDVHFVPRSNHLSDRKKGDWTYEVDNASQITLRYWLSEFENLQEPVLNSPCVTNAQDRSKLQNLLLSHLHSLKARVMAL